MTAYELAVTVVLLILTVFFAWDSARRYKLAAGIDDPEERARARRRALLWLAPAVMVFFCALYVVFRRGWLFIPVAAVGIGAGAWSMGGGLGEFMRRNS